MIEGEWAWIIATAILVITNPMQAMTILYAGQAYLISSLLPRSSLTTRTWAFAQTGIFVLIGIFIVVNHTFSLY